MINYYELLGVSENAATPDIKAAFRKLQMQVHPDRTGGDDTLAQLLNEAYETLKDDDKRAAYDLKRASGISETSGSETSMTDVFDDLKRRMNGKLSEAERFAKYPVADEEKYDLADAFDLSWTKIRERYDELHANNLNMPFGIKKIFGLAAAFGALWSNPAELGALTNVATAIGIGAGTIAFTHYARYVISAPIMAFEVLGNSLGKGLVAKFGKEKTGREQKVDVNRTTLVVKFAAIGGVLYGTWREGSDLSRDAIVKGLLQQDKAAQSLVWRAGEGAVRAGTQVVTGLLPK